jgi:hypothetical protein
MSGGVRSQERGARLARGGVGLGRWALGAFTALSLLTPRSSPLEAQRGSRMRDMAAMLSGSDYWTPPQFKGNVPYDGRYTFARVKYRGAGCWNQQGPGWSHDYPEAESHLVQILRELTSMRPNMTSSNIVSLEDPELFKHPVAYLSEPGCWDMSDKEVLGLRAYLKKGGFLIFDDFGDWGRRELLNTEYQLRRAIPGAQIVKLDVTHPIFDAFFHIKSLDIIDQTYRGIPEYWGVFQDNDPKKRLIAILNVNNDIGENWEFSNTGFVPIPISNESYKLGVNYLVYAMTH